jgi:hypothetical protein
MLLFLAKYRPHPDKGGWSFSPFTMKCVPDVANLRRGGGRQIVVPRWLIG